MKTVVVLLLFFFISIVQSVSAQTTTTCTDVGDNGIDAYAQGDNFIINYTQYPYPQITYYPSIQQFKDALYYFFRTSAQVATPISPDVVPDFCVDEKKGILREFSCASPQGPRVITDIQCPNGCYMGTEVRTNCASNPTLECYKYRGFICNGPEINKTFCDAVGKWANPDGDIFTRYDNCCYTGNINQQGRFTIDSSGKKVACIPQAQILWDTARLKEGAIFKITRSPALATNLVKTIEYEDDYDVVGDSQGEWLVCDPDSSLNQFTGAVYPFSPYAPPGSVFGPLSSPYGKGKPCDPSFPSEICINIASGLKVNEFICAQTGEREAIFECSADTVRGQTSQLYQGDDYDARIQGESVPTPLILDTASFNRADVCSDPAEYCTVLANVGDSIETSTFAIYRWQDYDYVQFNLFVNNQTKSRDLLLELRYDSYPYSNNFVLSNYVVAQEKESSGYWQLVRIPTNHHPGKITLLKISSQQANIGEIKLADFTFWGNNVFYCSREIGATNATANWISDLDKDDARGAACNGGRFTQWTGTRCCGDDTILTPQVLQIGTGRFTIDEIYNDTQGLCFFSKAYPTTPQKTVELVEVPSGVLAFNDAVTRTRNEHPLLMNGTQLIGCGFSLSINQTTNTNPIQYFGTLPIKNVAPCTTITDPKTGDAYFCAQNGWSNTSYTYQYQGSTQVVNAGQRSVQSYTLPPQSWSCCAATTCWNGTVCVAPPLPTFTQQPTTGTNILQCVNGQWINGSVMFDWLKEEYGSCPSTTHCFFDKDASFAGSSDPTLQNATLCKPNQWYSRIADIPGALKDNNNPGSPYNKVADLYCDSGQWTSRTRFIAEKLLTIPRNNNIGSYSLVCGARDQVLQNDANGKAYRSVFSNANAPLSFTNSYDTEYFNHLCILSYKQAGRDIVVIGSSYNTERTQQFTGGGIDLPVIFSEAFDIAPFDISNCQNAITTGDFSLCTGTRSRSTSSTSAFYWNNRTQSFIYTSQGGLVLGGGAVNQLYDILVTPLLSLIRSVPKQNYQTQPLVLEDARLLNNIYISQIGSKKITAFTEAKQDSDMKIKEFFAVRYENSRQDICPSVTAYDAEVVPSTLKTMICYTNASTTTVFGKINRHQPSDVPALEEFFRAISRSTRLR